ncbi:transposase, partial [Xanthocytophaga agilis]
LCKQSLNERFSAKSVTFLKKVVEELIEKQSDQYQLSTFSNFKHILIGDCTSFALPASLGSTYKGPGGIYPSSAIKLYCEYDFLSGSFSCLEDDGWARSDQTFNNASRVDKGDLILKDLGFYQVPFFRELHQKGAYFISRLRAGSSLYNQEKRMDLASLIKDNANDYSLQEYSVSIGNNKKERSDLGPVRLILEKVPTAVYQQKMKRTKTLCASKGK